MLTSILATLKQPRFHSRTTHMTNKIYKYFGPDLAQIALLETYVLLKCSLPRDFNDPYELFLTVDFSSDASALACYQEAIGSIPQLPTTCFSTSPAVSPMWAHYAHNVSGFVLEFDEDELRKVFPKSRLDNVKYQDEVDSGLTEMLYRAHIIGKPRYTYFLQGGTYNAAYFTKASCWSYELERRMIVEKSSIRSAEDHMLLDVPMGCVTAIIAGARAHHSLVDKLTQHAQLFDCNFFKMKIGKTTIAPFFMDENNIPYVFDGTNLIRSSNSCQLCYEPIFQENSLCSWCQITDAHRNEAALRNPYRLLDQIGELGSYIESMDSVSSGRIRKKR